MPKAFSFVVQKVNPSRDGEPTRVPIGRLQPVGGATIVWELNRPGSLELPVNLQSVPVEIDEALNAWMAGSAARRRLELVVYYEGVTAPVWAGPLSSFTYSNFDRVTFRAKGDLAWLDEMVIYEEIEETSGIDQFAMVYDIVTQGQTGTTGLANYIHKGIRLDNNRRGLDVYPGGDGDTEISPLRAETVLEILERISDLSDEYKFDYQIRRTPGGNLVFEVSREIGQNLTGTVVLGHDPVIEDVDVTVTFTPNNHCTIVYAVGDGPEGTDSSEENRVWYLAGRHNPGEPNSIHTALTQLGVTVYPVSATGIRRGRTDGSNVDANELRGSIEEYAETVLNARQVPWIIPGGFKAKVDLGDDDGVLPFAFAVGDTISLRSETGFGVGEATEARVQKKTLVTGPLPTVSVEFE